MSLFRTRVNPDAEADPRRIEGEIDRRFSEKSFPAVLSERRQRITSDLSHEHAAFIKVFHLPSYSSDLTPDEYLNRDLKSNLNNKPLGRAKRKIEE